MMRKTAAAVTARPKATAGTRTTTSVRFLRISMPRVLILRGRLLAFHAPHRRWLVRIAAWKAQVQFGRGRCCCRHATRILPRLRRRLLNDAQDQLHDIWSRDCHFQFFAAVVVCRIAAVVVDFLRRRYRRHPPLVLPHGRPRQSGGVPQIALEPQFARTLDGIGTQADALERALELFKRTRTGGGATTMTRKHPAHHHRR